MHHSFAITELNSPAAWRGWQAQWDQLVQHQPMRSTTWLMEWWSRFATPRDQLRVWLLQENGQLVGIAPLYTTRSGSRSNLRLLGDTGNVCTDHTTWFALPGYEDRVGQAVGEQLLADQSWHRLQLEAIDPHESAMASTLRVLREAGCCVHSSPTAGCWALELPADWETYLRSLSKNHRKRCRRWSRQYFESGQVQIHTAEPNHEDGWERAWQVMRRLHRERWGNSTRPEGCFSDPRFTQFHESVSRQLLSDHQLRLCYLTMQDQPIASEYQFMDGDTLYAYQSGMSLQHQDQSPGNLSVLATIRFCFDRGIRKLDFLRGDECYKSHWLAERSARVSIRVWRAGLTGQMALRLQQARGFVSQFVGN